jgi:spore germination protein KC
MTKKIFMFLMLGLVILINGCWDRRELESLGLVQALGLDLGEGGKGITVTTMIAIPSKISGGAGGQGGGGGGSDTGVFTISMSAPTFYEAFNLINTTINREITLIQNSAILIGEDLAKKDLRKIIDNLARFREMRRTIRIFVCQGRANEIMNVQPKLEKNPSEYFTDLSNLSYRTGMFPVVTLNDFMNSYEAFAQENYAPVLSKYTATIPGDSNDASKGPKSEPSPKSDEKPTSGEKSIRITGTAIFRKAKLVGTFDLYESIALQLLTGQFREALLSTPDPREKDNQIAYRLLATQLPRIKHTHRQDGPDGSDQLKIKIKLEADILSIQSGLDYTTPKNEVLLGNHIAREIEGRIQKVIKKAQKVYASDVFGLGKTVRSTFLTSTAWENYHWPERFPDAKITVNVKVALRRVGVQFQPPKLR